MNNELLNRILTSIFLLPIIIYATLSGDKLLIILLTFFYFLSIYEIINNTKNLLFILFASGTLLVSFYSFYFLRGDNHYSLTILFWILISTFLSDTGGYLFGKILKGKKLTKLSPNKTYSGAIGSIILSCLSLPLINLLQTLYIEEILIDFLNLKFLIITIVISLTCQSGDLTVSLLKRKASIKNTSNFLPGHGGILDRIDGLVFVLILSFALKLLELI